MVLLIRWNAGVGAGLAPAHFNGDNMKLIPIVAFLLASNSFAAAYPTAMSSPWPTPSPVTMAQAADHCLDLNESGQTDWRVPLVEEVAAFCDATAASTYIWVRELIGYKWVTIRLSDCNVSAAEPSANKAVYARCVR